MESIQMLCPDLDPLPEHKWIEQMEIEDSGDIETLGGVRSLLTSVPDKYWTIVTSATRRLALVRLKAGNVPFPAKVITADDVANGKPDPEPYRKGADLLGLAPEDCIVVEDSASGVRAGKEAGCRVLATTFSHSMESLAQADWIVESLEDVKVKVSSAGVGLEMELSPIARD
jgi:mannitol-1-/sugar-/sorbitol-6-phosphatase